MRRAKSQKLPNCPYVGKGGLKLEFALNRFCCDVEEKIAADFGSHQGGFVDCLLQHGAKMVYAVDTCYGTLAWKLRQNRRVVVKERTNAIHWIAPQPMAVITIDVAWTRQQHIVPNAIANLDREGTILTLLKPQYEMHRCKSKVLPKTQVASVVEEIDRYFTSLFRQVSSAESPYTGSGGNTEVWFCLRYPKN